MPDDETTEDEAAPEEEAPAEEAAAPEPEPEPTPVIAPEHEPLLEVLQQHLGDGIVDAVSNHGDLVVRVANEAWHAAAETAKVHLDCDYLSFIAGIDWQVRQVAPTDDAGSPTAPVQPTESTYGVTGSDGRFQVFAVVESTTRHTQVVFKADVDEANPIVASWVDVYAGADWHERECFEMYGFRFDGHPHLRHLYLPGEFEGHPLRKDFPLLAREVKPWPGLVDVEAMPGADEPEAAEAAATAEGGE